MLKNQTSRKASTLRKPRERKDKDFDRRATMAAWDIVPATELETSFRHSHWTARRAKVTSYLEKINTSSFALDRWKNCGSGCTVEVNKETKKIRLRANYCRCRHCEPCMRAKAQKIAINLREALSKTKSKERRFITFTLKASDKPLEDQIKRLYKAFRKVRSSKLWKRTQKGGAAMLEVKWNGDHWHPHLHVVAEGSWIRQGDLSSLWHDATGDSFIVDIKLLENCDKTIGYVTKYVTKSVPPNVWDNEAKAIEWMIASKGVRTCLTFGSWRGVKLTATKKEPGKWKRLCSVNSLYEACCRAEPWALALVRAFDQQRHTEHNNANRPPPQSQVV